MSRCPWPLQDVALVETDRVREISLGFEQDLAGPVLWTEPHYVGEQNLLVGDGESLLTIDVPIQYQVADPVAFLTATSDPAAALKSLAERRLVQAAQSRESFAIMTSGRTQIAAEIEQGLQEEADRHGLGLKILFVGLKDVHPPVDVAPAYEKVVSSQERKEAAIDLARAYEAQVLPDAQTDANRLISDAGAAATQRLDQATGEARRFTLLASAEQEAPELLRLRWRYDVLDQGLAGPGKFIVGLSGAQAPGTYLDFRGQKDVPLAPPTGSALPAPPPLPDRGTRKEMPER
ncbi:MAG: protease modulator HflK [Verrucomicrobiota bacterium]